MRVIVCGGRNYDDHHVVYVALKELEPGPGREPPTIVHGAASGADTLAGAFAAMLGFFVEPHPADWKRHAKAAGPIRNQQMLDAGADLVIAFPGGRGTEDMVRRATAAGVKVQRAP